MTVEDRLLAMGLVLPEVAAPAANYVPFVRSGDQVVIAGQIPFLNGVRAHIGRVGEGLSIEQGAAAARDCALNILAQAKAAVGGDWGRIIRLIRLGGFVNAAPDFTDHPKVVNGASDLMVAVLGDAGRHARFAVGVSSLPFGVAVEVDAVFAVRD